jgi:hypothetical protein
MIFSERAARKGIAMAMVQGDQDHLADDYKTIDDAGGQFYIDGQLCTDFADFLAKLANTDIDGAILHAEFTIIRQNMAEAQAPLQWLKNPFGKPSAKYIPTVNVRSHATHPFSPYSTVKWQPA